MRFFGENLSKLPMISVFLPCKSKGGLVLSSGIRFANKHNDVQSISNDCLVSLAEKCDPCVGENGRKYTLCG